MAHRVIKDAHGETWDVWEVHPSAESAILRGGWLAFQSRDEKRRLAPVPDGWEERSDDDLLALLDAAESQGRPKRLIE